MLATSRAWESSGKPEIQQLQWNPFALKCVNDLGETGEAVEKERKSASWKAAVAAYLMERTQADNAWLAGGLHMDSTNATSH